MKKILTVALCGSLLNSYGMPIVSNPYLTENCGSENKSQILKSTKENLVLKRNKSIVVDTFEMPNGIPIDSILNYEEWNDQTEENKSQLDKIYAMFLIIRHVGDMDNLRQQTHTDSPNNIVSIETVGPVNAFILKILGEIVNPDVIGAGDSDRHIVTARFIASGSDGRYKVYTTLNEQRLGSLGGKSMRDVLSDSDLAKMLSDPNYRIDEKAETGAETIKRFNIARDKLLFCALKSRYKKLDLSIKVLDEIFADKERQEDVKAIMNFISNNPTEAKPLITNLLEDPIRIIIVSSRSIINWELKDGMGNMDLPLQLTPNCYTYCSKVSLFGNKRKFLKTKEEYGNQPCSLSPTDLTAFVLNDPSFNSATHKFKQNAARIISYKKEEKQIGSNKVSRNNSFSESRSDSTSSEYLINSNISYLESSSINRNNSNRNSIKQPGAVDNL